MDQMQAAEQPIQLDPQTLITKLLARLTNAELVNAQLETLVDMLQAELSLLRSQIGRAHV